MSYTNRSEIPEKYKWNLGDIFATPADWEATFAKISKDYKQLASYQGKLADRDTLLKFFRKSDELEKVIEKLYCYAFMSYNEDAQDAEKQGRYARIYAFLTECGTLTSFVSPELSALPDKQLKALIADPDFADYDVQLKRLLEGKAHILSQAEEKLLAGVGA
ncbi:MAG: oligoendopeptidase F, partial [Clostridia bacterium]|nr:oligoendopeptidase F [Clostridia bacterium]